MRKERRNMTKTRASIAAVPCLLVAWVLMGGCVEKEPPSKSPGTVVTTSGGAVPRVAGGASVINQEERRRVISAFLADLTPAQVEAANRGFPSQGREDWSYFDAGCLRWADLTENQKQAILDAVLNFEAECRAAQQTNPQAWVLALSEIGEAADTELRQIEYYVLEGPEPDLVRVHVDVSRNRSTVTVGADLPRSEIPAWFFEKAINARERHSGVNE